VHGTNPRRYDGAVLESGESGAPRAAAHGVAPVSEHDRRIMALRAAVQDARAGEVRVREGWQESFLDGWEHEGREPA